MLDEPGEFVVEGGACLGCAMQIDDLERELRELIDATDDESRLERVEAMRRGEGVVTLEEFKANMKAWRRRTT